MPPEGAAVRGGLARVYAVELPCRRVLPEYPGGYPGARVGSQEGKQVVQAGLFWRQAHLCGYFMLYFSSMQDPGTLSASCARR